MEKRFSGLVTNEGTPGVQSNLYTYITFNLKADKAKVRHDTMSGKDHLVVPCVMMTEGVHKGSMGPLYYSEEELSKAPVVWNNKPVVVYHPVPGTSACDPDIITKQGIGVLMNTRYDGGLKSECWLEVEKTKEVDDRVLNSLEDDAMMEVSTGVFIDKDSESGEWNGEQYEGIARNMRPDHLAILPDKLGACSIEDGAGLLRNAQEGTAAEKKLAESLAKVFNELSHDEIWRALNDKIQSSVSTDVWVDTVFDDFFIYHDGDKLFYQKYEMTEDDEVKLEGVRMEAEKETQFRLADGTVVGNEECVLRNQEAAMDKKKVVDGLISNEASPWSEEDRKVLMARSEDQLTAIVGNQDKPEDKPEEKKPEVKPEENEEKPEDKPEDKPEEKKPEENEEMTPDQYISNAPEGMQDMLRAGLQQHAVVKDALIQKITANERNSFTAEQLQGKSVEELTALAQLAQDPAAPAPVSQPHFAGQAPVTPAENQEGEEPLEAPALNFESEG